jgi:hypothetical protein
MSPFHHVISPLLLSATNSAGYRAGRCIRLIIKTLPHHTTKSHPKTMPPYDLKRQSALLRFCTRPLMKSVSAWRAPQVTLSKHLILVLGAQRSGTTLMFLMLTAHPKMTGLDESHARPICGTVDLLPPWPVIAANLFLGKRTLYKLPVSSVKMQDITTGFPHTQLVWMIRDPFAVVASMRKLRFPDGQSWLTKFGLAQARTTVAITAPEILHSLDTLDEVSLGAMIWKHRILLMEQYRAHGMRLHPVKYEELVRAPRQVMQDLLAALGFDWSDQVLAHQQLHGETQYAGFTSGARAIDQQGLARGQELNAEEQEKISAIAADVMARFSYS